MSAAAQIYYTRFDAQFFLLPKNIRDRIEAKIDEMGLRLKTFPHYHLTGGNRYRLRIGDYRIIYTFDSAQNLIHLLAVGHRREIYRGQGIFRLGISGLGREISRIRKVSKFGL